MKIKTSITLSQEVIQAIDNLPGTFKNRSEVIETALWAYVHQIERIELHQRDLALMNLHADELHAEAEDVLDFQADI